MIKFGVAGNSVSFYNEGYKHTHEAAKWCKNRGIEVFEYSFGKGVRMIEDTAVNIGRAFKNAEVELSIHAPYYINFANTDPAKIANSIHYVMQCLRIQDLFSNGDRIVIHPATQGKLQRSEAVSLAKSNLRLLADSIIENGYSDKKICLETMGKIMQIGDEREICELCDIAPFFYPCIDFGHLNARTCGGIKTKTDYEEIICYLKDNLPYEKLEKMHVHFSKIMYGKCGEIKHLTFEDEVYGPEFEPLAEVLIKYGLSPVVICESDGTQAEDAIKMKNIYNFKLIQSNA